MPASSESIRNDCARCSLAAVSVPEPASTFPLRPPVRLPEGVSESALRAFLESVRVTEGSPDELLTYCREDFWRFVRTYNLVEGLAGSCLELGANPYFTTMLLREFTGLQLELANYFGPSRGVPRKRWRRRRAPRMKQTVVYRDLTSGQEVRIRLSSHVFNIERERFPFEDDRFDVVLCCEIIEHLTADPLAALWEIKRVLRQDGVLVLTTPNVNRLENVVKMVAGVNIYDPYSGYGPYGRHNREYNKHELHLLLTYAGFQPDCLESADVHENSAGDHLDWRPLVPLLKNRELDLGQYLFVRAGNLAGGGRKRPKFLYRSYPAGELGRVSPATGA
jgi:SAM-dependent methyltransferase